MADKKYYWLKLKRDFFKRHDIRIIEAMPNGKDYILFYLKLLCESVDHGGNLRFNDDIPYNDSMLATITNTNIDVVRAAVDIFTKLGMMEIMDDGTFFMQEVTKMVGSETEWAEKKRLYRENKNLSLGHSEDNVQQTEDNVLSTEDNVQTLSGQKKTMSDKSKSKSKSKSKNNILSPAIAEEFEKLWILYPQERRQGKKKALEYYSKAKKAGTTFEEVETGIKAYSKYIKVNKTEKQFIKMASTFFSQQAWQDDWTVPDYDDDLDDILI